MTSARGFRGRWPRAAASSSRSGVRSSSTSCASNSCQRALSSAWASRSSRRVFGVVSPRRTLSIQSDMAGVALRARGAAGGEAHDTRRRYHRRVPAVLIVRPVTPELAGASEHHVGSSLGHSAPPTCASARQVPARGPALGTSLLGRLVAPAPRCSSPVPSTGREQQPHPSRPGGRERSLPKAHARSSFRCAPPGDRPSWPLPRGSVRRRAREGRSASGAEAGDNPVRPGGGAQKRCGAERSDASALGRGTAAALDPDRRPR